MHPVNFSSFFSILAINLWLRLISFNFFGISIGRGSWIKSLSSIGTGTGIGWNFTVRGAGKLAIGRYCAIGENVRVITSNHSIQYLAINFALQSRIIGKRMIDPKMDVLIGNDVWIGDEAIILPGVSIGDGAIVGAGAVVTKSVEPFFIVAGNPARPIKKRFNQEVIDNIVLSSWWNWSPSEMKLKKELFQKRLDQ